MLIDVCQKLLDYIIKRNKLAIAIMIIGTIIKISLAVYLGVNR